MKNVNFIFIRVINYRCPIFCTYDIVRTVLNRDYRQQPSTSQKIEVTINKEVRKIEQTAIRELKFAGWI